jgi:hypothetical protein
MLPLVKKLKLKFPVGKLVLDAKGVELNLVLHPKPVLIVTGLDR